MRSLVLRAVIPVLVLVFSLPVWAQLPGQQLSDQRFAETPLINDRLNLSVGGYLVDFDTAAAAGISGGAGGGISLEEVLGFDKSRSFFRLDGLYRFNSKHAIAFGYHGFSRSGSGIFAGEVEFGGLRFVGDYEGRGSMNVVNLAYRRSLLNNGRLDVGFTAGLSTFDIDVYIEGEAVVIGDDPDQPVADFRRADQDVIAPVPTVGLFIDYAFSPIVIFKISAAFLDVDVGAYEGRLIETRITLDWFLSRHWGIGGGLGNTDVRIINSGDQPFRFGYRYDGFLVYVAVSF